ncbi:EAL domain-containing protein [Legionella waltersii]|uniref:Regulatory protein (GGDEF, EAL, PAS and PAC domains) n=1 Tax=Legionella waltersii TaxID=66969 RepID=A0A0W1AM94_9GAMM|nr:EAL domain-containing protein [Legionella waltersii]KTD82414.1 regulatory protein (GGDEF, EAL, PAS and PAC domains) [Legionella waltersii]SNU95599.1 regulatory protein (GGDEF, EAL, PAS and PAC domains) [Legionella waltersii]
MSPSFIDDNKDCFKIAFDYSPTGIVLATLDGYLNKVNSAFCKMLGYDKDELQNMHFRDITHPDDLESSLDNVQQLVHEKISHFQMTKRYVCKNGHITWANVNVSMARDESQIPLYFIINILDNNKQKDMEAQLERKAYFDELTGLVNRNQLEHLFDRVLSTSRRHNRKFAVLFLDLDKFKQINDTLGHAAGDQLLKLTAERLKNCHRSDDIVSRLGGDEFVVILTDLSRDDSAAIAAEKIKNSLLRPAKIMEHEVYMAVSIGISIYPTDGVHYQTLIRNADSALYKAKENGGNNYQFYTNKPNLKDHRTIDFESALLEALDKNEFQLYFQPKIDIIQNRVIALEALLRWQHHEFGTVSPQQMLPLAEETGLIIQLGDWIINTACVQTSLWQRAGFPSLTVSINVSPRQFRQPDFADSIIKALNISKLAPHFLELEFSESLAMQDPEYTLQTINTLKNLGIKITIDNFGTGYSSLRYLQRFGVDHIKIDQTVIQNAHINSWDASLVVAMIELAKNLQFEVIVQGVETKEQYTFLKNNGCDKMQGYYFSVPMTIDNTTEFLKEFKF